MDRVLKEKGNKPIELVQKLPPTPAVFLVDSRACLIDSLIKGMRESGHYTHVRSCDTVEDLLKESSNQDNDRTTVILSLTVVDINNLSESVRSIRNDFSSNTQIVILADDPDVELVRQMSENHINGVIPSSYNTKQAIACLKAIDAGILFVPSELMTAQINHPTVDRLMGRNSKNELRETLTPRQSEVLELLCVGRSNKYIAAELSLCESTVKVHVSEIMKRLGATSRTHASYLYKQILDHEDSLLTDPD